MIADFQRQLYGQRRERAQTAGHDEPAPGRFDRAPRPLATHEAEADGEQAIAAEGVVHLRFGGGRTMKFVEK